MTETIERNATAPTLKRDTLPVPPEQPRPVKLLDQVRDRIRVLHYSRATEKTYTHTLGSAFSQGADVEGAAGEVMRANLSKLQGCDVCPSAHKELRGAEYVCDALDCNGLGRIAIKDANGKVKKSSNFVPPDLTPYICKL